MQPVYVVYICIDSFSSISFVALFTYLLRRMPHHAYRKYLLSKLWLPAELKLANAVPSLRQPRNAVIHHGAPCNNVFTTFS